jgi:transposase
MSERKTQRNDALARYYAKGHSIRECASKFGITLQMVHIILRRDRPDLLRAPGKGMGMSPAARLEIAE